MSTPRRTALVTGGNRGIGREIVRGLAALGHTVWLASRDLAAGEEAAATMHNEPGEVRPIQLDLTDDTSITAAIARIQAADEPLDILVNNAAVYPQADLFDISDDEMRETLAINQIGPWRLMRAFVPRMQARGFGRVVNLSSGYGSIDEGLRGPAGYSWTKAGINALTIIAAQAVHGDVLINSMCPGWVHTRMGGDSAPRSPERGADTAIWLATLPPDTPDHHGRFYRDRKPIAW